MDTTVLILLVLLVLLAAGAVAFFLYQKNRSEQLKQRFGPEYEKTISETGRLKGERELDQRRKRVESLELRQLPPEERRRYADEWQLVQADFAEEPSRAVLAADELVQRVMASRGYPMTNFEQRAADLSVEHGEVVSNYRAAHEISVSHRDTPRSTEALRQAMIHYRALFSELLGEVSTGQRGEQESLGGR